jgi:hypothetical protein
VIFEILCNLKLNISFLALESLLGRLRAVYIDVGKIPVYIAQTEICISKADLTCGAASSDPMVRTQRRERKILPYSVHSFVCFKK